MAVVELRVALATDCAGLVEEFLAEREEQRLMVVEDKPSGQAWLAGYFPAAPAAREAWAEVVAAAPGGWFAGGPDVRDLVDRDWKESYKDHFKAWRFGRLHWVPVWERAAFRLPPGDEVLWLDPGMAFGTGNHETTRLVVERLVAWATAHGTGARVIDAGCGSGILALSAARLGFSAVAAFDNDPLAVEVSRANAALNDLSARVEFYVGDLKSGLAGRQAELVLANIQADVLVAFAGPLCAAVAPGGRLVLSGILANELAQVRQAFIDLAPGWNVGSRVLGEWSDLTLDHPGASRLAPER